MARYDKAVPGVGVHRAEMGFAAVAADLNKIFGVGLSAAGRLVKGGTPMVGVLIVTRAMAIGEVADYMNLGEIVEAALSDGTTPIAAGVQVYAVPGTGLLSVTAVANQHIGHTLEGGAIASTRLVVAVANNAVGA